MRQLFFVVMAMWVSGLLAGCGQKSSPTEAHNQGFHVTPLPARAAQGPDAFTLTKGAKIYAAAAEAQSVAAYYAAKLNASTGYGIGLSDRAVNKGISLLLDDSLALKDEGYMLVVAPEGVTVSAKTASGLFYGMATFLQLLPAEIAHPTPVAGMAWRLPSFTIKDNPRFADRAVCLDAPMPAEALKKHIDALAMFKINRLRYSPENYTAAEQDELARFAAERFVSFEPIAQADSLPIVDSMDGIYGCDSLPEAAVSAGFPQAIALAEAAWSPQRRKDYIDFVGRLDNAYVRLDAQGVDYDLPQPEQPDGYAELVRFTDKATVTLKVVQPMRIVYTTDGSDPTPSSAIYAEPFNITESLTLRVAFLTPSGKMSGIRTIRYEKS